MPIARGEVLVEARDVPPNLHPGRYLHMRWIDAWSAHQHHLNVPYALLDVWVVCGTQTK
jgi:hypothetical protein